GARNVARGEFLVAVPDVAVATEEGADVVPQVAGQVKGQGSGCIRQSGRVGPEELFVRVRLQLQAKAAQLTPQEGEDQRGEIHERHLTKDGRALPCRRSAWHALTTAAGVTKLRLLRPGAERPRWSVETQAPGIPACGRGLETLRGAPETLRPAL